MVKNTQFGQKAFNIFEHVNKIIQQTQNWLEKWQRFTENDIICLTET